MKLFRFWVRTVFSCVFLLLLAVFTIRIFAPGTDKTAFIFQKIQTLQPWLDQGIALLIYPITFGWDALVKWMPQLQNPWFPITPAVQVMEVLAALILKLPSIGASPVGEALRGADLHQLFPGVMDWRLLVILPFWGALESLLMQGISMMEARQYRWYIQQRDAEMLRSFQERGK